MVKYRLHKSKFKRRKTMNDLVSIIGAGLAGCEAAWQITQRGIKVDLYDMKSSKFLLTQIF